ncbi:MAG: hypothetical protein ACP5LI_03865, partial [Hydrogenobaculum sp.]
LHTYFAHHILKSKYYIKSMENLNYSKFNRMFLAGKDKGDLSKELEHLLISVRVLYKSYMIDIENMDKEDIKYDYLEHKNNYENTIRPFLMKKDILMDKNLCEKAEQISKTYEEFLDTLAKKI